LRAAKPTLRPADAKNGDNAAHSFRAHDGWQPRPIAVAAGNHQQIVLIDRRGLNRDHHFAGRRRANVGDIDESDDFGRITERLDLDCLHRWSLRGETSTSR
jgi:hypothetical protein